MTTSTDTARSVLDEHARSIDALQQKLSSMPGIDQEKLKAAVQKYRAAHLAFQDDALGCMN